MFKEDLITIASMKGRRLMRKMRIDPYPDALIRRGLYRNEPRETAPPVLESAMMYTSAVGMEIMEGLAIVQDAVDRTALETSERKAEVDGALVRLRHQLGAVRATLVPSSKQSSAQRLSTVVGARTRLLKQAARIASYLRPND